jgi:hypothetical protein
MSTEVHRTAASVALTASFLMAICGIPLLRFADDCARGRFPEALALLSRPPTSAALSAWEDRIEQGDPCSSWVRSWYPWALYILLGDSTGNVINGKDGWLFYKESVDTATQRGEKVDLHDNACRAISELQESLRGKGATLLLVPIPNKETIYPDKLVGGSVVSEPKTSDRTRRFRMWLEEAGVPNVDLFDVFSSERSKDRAGGVDLYLKRDSHWSPRGAFVAARATASWLREHGLIDSKIVVRGLPQDLARNEAPSDLYDMLMKSWRPDGPEVVDVPIWPEVAVGNPKNAEILLLGDSFLGSYREQSQGFTAALRALTGCQITDVVVVGSPAKGVQALKTQLAESENIKLVIWLFAERKLGLASGIEGQWIAESIAPQTRESVSR